MEEPKHPAPMMTISVSFTTGSCIISGIAVTYTPSISKLNGLTDRNLKGKILDRLRLSSVYDSIGS